MTVQAFALSDVYRVPVMVLADGRVGQMMEPIRLHQGPPPPEPPKPWALTGAKGRPAQNIRSLYVQEGELERHNEVLQACYRLIGEREARLEETETGDCEWLIAAWGTCGRIAKGAIRQARARGLKVGLARPLTLWPFPSARLAELAGRVRGILVAEMNCGQMLEDVRLAANGVTPIVFSGYPGGRVPTVTDVFKALLAVVNGNHGKGGGAPTPAGAD